MSVTQNSPYISNAFEFEYPLSQRRFFKPKKIIIKRFNLKYFSNNLTQRLRWDNVKSAVNKRKTMSEKILAILTHKEITMNKREELKKNREMFLEKIDYFTKRKKPIIFTVIQIAFKIPNPLKIERTTPDLGELAFLRQLYDLTRFIQKIYEPGARIVIFGESYIFYNIVNISKKESENYFKTIKKWINLLGWRKNLVLLDLKKLEKKVPGFRQEYRKNLNILEKGWESNDRNIRTEIKKVANTLYLSLNTRKLKIGNLMNLFNRAVKNKDLEQKRQVLYNKALKKAFPYIAYHQTVKTSGLGELIFPHNIKLSFTYGENKLSIYPINKRTKLYPYHGVPLLDKNKKLTIKYEIDVLRSKNIKSYHITGDPFPFYYVKG